MLFCHTPQGGAYNSGRENVTNSFWSGFWYLDQLASFARTGHGAYCRQTLMGGHYGLLGKSHVARVTVIEERRGGIAVSPT